MAAVGCGTRKGNREVIEGDDLLQPTQKQGSTCYPQIKAKPRLRPWHLWAGALAIALLAIWAIALFDSRAHLGLIVGFKSSESDFSETAETQPAPGDDAAGPEHPPLVRAGYPRILLPQLMEWSGDGIAEVIKQRQGHHGDALLRSFPPCASDELPGLASCWLATGDPNMLRKLIAGLKAAELVAPRTQGEYGNLWALALAYDLARVSPAVNPADQRQIEEKIRKGVILSLELLDGTELSLWHGRATLASNAWLGAIVLNQQTTSNRILQARAKQHFLEIIAALSLTEAWPEGYTYWVNDRGFFITLAASAYLNGLAETPRADEIRQLLERVGYWHVYATRPDDRIQGFGDEGPRVDLREDTRRIIDLIVGATQNPILAAFSRYLGNLHGPRSYYQEYRWGFLLFNDPLVTPAEGDEFLDFAAALPTATVFGRGALNLAYIRGGWSRDDTFITLRAGHSFTHHGHYDAGGFTLFKGAPLALNSSVYGDYTGSNRLSYAIRTIAKNSLLILRPNELVSDSRLFSANVADGGQRLTMPTGSALTGVSDWRRNLGAGLHLEGGRLEQFDHRPGDYTYLSADITHAYNTPGHDEGGDGGKVTLVRRELMYLDKEDRLILHDRVESTDASYVKKWILHTRVRPHAAALSILQGTAENGILESRGESIRIEDEGASLHIHRLLPQQAVTRLVGGKDYQYYIEDDGDESKLDGHNYSQGAIDKPWYDNGLWRVEIQPLIARKIDRFLTLLTPRLEKNPVFGDRPMPIAVNNGTGIATTESVTLFLENQPIEPIELYIPSHRETLRIACLGCSDPIQLSAGNYRTHLSSAGGAVYHTHLRNLPTGQITLSTVTD